MPSPYSAKDTVVLTSTTGSQTVTVPSGSNTMLVYNGSANPVFLKWAASVAVPGATFGGTANGVLPVQGGTSQVFSIPNGGGALSYIASTAGGSLVISVGDGE